MSDRQTELLFRVLQRILTNQLHLLAATKAFGTAQTDELTNQARDETADVLEHVKDELFRLKNK